MVRTTGILRTCLVRISLCARSGRSSVSVKKKRSALTMLFIVGTGTPARSEEHTSELQSLMRISYAVFCLKKKNINTKKKVKRREHKNTHRNTSSQYKS